jgi:hypothetical protein
VFTQGSRAAILHVHDYLEYKCFTSGPGTSNICEVLGMTFRCDSMSDNNEYCMVKGRMVVHVLQGIGLDQTAPLRSFRFLALIFIISRLCILVVMHYPYDSIVAMIRTFLSNGENEELIDMQIRNRCLDGTYDITHFLHFYSLIVICD